MRFLQNINTHTRREPIEHDKISFETTWIKDESQEELEYLPKPEILAVEIIENLGAP